MNTRDANKWRRAQRTVSAATESKKYEGLLKSASKEKLIKILNNYQQQIVDHKDELFAVHYEDQDYSTPDYDHGCDPFQPGDKIYCQRFGRPPKFVGTAMDHNELSREQLFEVVWEA